jgi:hypothetical protein
MLEFFPQKTDQVWVDKSRNFKEPSQVQVLGIIMMGTYARGWMHLKVGIHSYVLKKKP